MGKCVSLSVFRQLNVGLCGFIGGDCCVQRGKHLVNGCAAALSGVDGFLQSGACGVVGGGIAHSSYCKNFFYLVDGNSFAICIGV